MPDIKHAILTGAAEARIHDLVSSGPGLAQWWAEDMTTAQTGHVELGFFDRSVVYRLVSEHSADEIRWRCETGEEWAGTALVFRTQPDESGQTRIELRHEKWEAETPYFIRCNTVWGHLMFRLKHVAEGGRPRPFFTTSATEEIP